jgi:hypothetical protein
MEAMAMLIKERKANESSGEIQMFHHHLAALAAAASSE